MKKKSLTLVLALSVIMSTITGCGSGGQEESTKENEVVESESEESGSETESGEIPLDAFAGTEITIAVNKRLSDKSESFNDKPIFKMAEEATGIHINWIEVDEAAATEKTNIMLTSDMPDAFLWLLNESQIATNLDLFYDLSEDGLLEKYAPNVLADYETMENGLDMITWPDGSIRSLITGNQVSRENDPDGIFVINKAWLDQLNMDIPETADEFYEVLCAFRDNDMNGNGDTTDEIPLEFCANNWAAKTMTLAGSFGIAVHNGNEDSAYYKVEDGKVYPTMNTEECRAFLEYYHKLGQEGLLDLEGFSQTSDQFGTKIKEKVVGVFSGWTAMNYLSPEDAQDYVTLKPFKAVDGVEPLEGGTKDRFSGFRFGLAASAEFENVPALLHWWNYMSSSTELKYTARLGERGQKWDFDEDGNVYEKVPEALPEGWTEEDFKNTYGIVDMSPFIRKDEAPVLNKDLDPNDSKVLRNKMVDEVFDMLPEEDVPVRIGDVDKVNERTFIEIELFNYLGNFVATSIVEGVTDESWQTHLDTLDALQYNEWIDWWQGFVDGEY